MAESRTADVILELPGIVGMPDRFRPLAVATTANLSLGLDVSNHLGFWKFVPLAPACALTDPTGADVELADTPLVTGGVISQNIDGSALTAGTGYTLTYSWENADGSVFVTQVRVLCPF